MTTSEHTWRPFASTVAAEVASKGAVVATTLVAARQLSAAQFAAYAAMTAVALLAAACWDAGVSTVVTRETARGFAPALRTLVRLRMRTSPLWLAAFALGTVALLRSADIEGTALLLFAGASWCAATHTLTLARLRGAMRFGAAGGALAAGRLAAAALSIAVLLATNDDALSWLAAALLAGEASTLAISCVALAAQRDAATTNPIRLRDAMPFALNSVLATAYSRLDIIAVAGLASAYELGAYAPASRLQDAMYLLPAATGTVALPVLSRAWSVPNGLAHARATGLKLCAAGLVIALPAAVVLSAAAPLALRLALGDGYEEAATPARILAWSLPLGVVGSVLLAALAASGHAGETTLIFAVAFGVALTMHLLLDARFGATGGAIASLARDPVAVLVAGWCVWRAGLFGGAPQPRASVQALQAEALS